MANINCFSDPACPSPSAVDVVIIGGGLAGTLAAIFLERIGLQVALVDLHDIYPPDFRAEQLVGSQVDTLSRMGVLDLLVHGLVPAERAVAMRAGATVGVVTAPHYGILYNGMVNSARRFLPSAVQFIRGRVIDVVPSADRQRVILQNGDVVTGRLVILATGFGQRLQGKLGIGKATVRAGHSLAFGFDLEVASPGLFQSSVLVAYGEQPAGAIDYLTIFPVGNRLRANLFTYGSHRDAWTKQFVRDPADTIRQALPSLERTTGRIAVQGPVQVRVNDLLAASDYRRDGVVLVSDAFQTSCPAAGTGIGRLLNDIDLLCNLYIPKWLSTEGMGANKIQQFYGDPLKRRHDAEALRVANYRRSLITETSLRWKIHRQRVAFQNQIRLLAQRNIRRISNAQTPMAGATMAPVVLAPLTRKQQG